MNYVDAYEEGFKSEATAPTACPHAPGYPDWWAWLDGQMAAQDAARQEGLAGSCIMFAVHDRDADLYRSFHRYPGEAHEAASRFPEATVEPVLFNAIMLEPDFNEPIQDVTGNSLQGHPMLWNQSKQA